MAESLDFIFERANSALITQDFEYAEQLLTNVLKKHQDISPVDREKIEGLLARIYGDEGDLERSLAAYLRLYAREPDNTDVMISLGRIYRHLDRYEDALKILEKAKQTGGETDEVLYNLAKTYKRMRNYDKAVAYFSRAIEIKPDHAHAYDRLGNLYVLIGENDKAIETFKNGLRIDPNHPYLNFHLADLLRRYKQYEQAIVYYNAALRINPSWNEVLSGIAAAYMQLDKLDDALNTYRSLLRVNGESALIYTELGYLFEKKQLQQEAEQYYYDALAIDSGYAPAALALTRLLEKKQRYEQAMPVLLAAESASVNAGDHSLRLKAIQMCMYAKDYAKAHELLGRVAEEHSNDIHTLKLKGQLCALTGKTEEAEKAFKKMLQADSSAIEFRKELAEQYILADKYEQAKEQLKLFLQQQPADIHALMALGGTEEMLNNSQAAYRHYQKVLEIKPDAFEARSALSRLFQKRGDTIEALKTANEILNLQSAGSIEDHTQGLAETLDLYEQAAESYTTDPLLTKNLESLKADDSELYLSPAELAPESASDTKPYSLTEITKSEQELPFELLVEDAEDLEELPEADILNDDILPLQTSEASIPVSVQPLQTNHQTALPLNETTQERPSPETPAVQQLSPPFEPAVPQGYSAKNDPLYAGSAELLQAEKAQAPIVPQAGSMQYGRIDTTVFSSPVRELYLTGADGAVSESGTVHNTVFAIPQPVKKAHKAETAEDRLKNLDTYGTAVEFLRDLVTDTDRQFDEKRYEQAVDLLAERIAANLNTKLFDSNQIQKSMTSSEISAPPETTETLSSVPIHAPLPEAVLTAAQANSTVVQPETTAGSNDTAMQAARQEVVSTTADQANSTAAQPKESTDHSGDFGGDSLPAVSDEEPEFSDAADTAQIHPETDSPFSLDREQQNVLWCHARHRVKDSPAFESYLSTADPEKLAELFLYLRNLFAFLPQEELDVFLNSSERMQIYYIIARLSGEIGLKARADLIRQTESDVHAGHPCNEEAILDLLKYLRDLSVAMPDQEIGARIREELEQLMANMLSVLPSV